MHARGRRSRRGVLSVTYLADPTTADEPPRVAYALSRRVGNAVLRNRVRRRLRAVVHDLATQGSILAPGAYLIAATPAAPRSTPAELHHDLTAALRALRATGPAHLRAGGETP